MNEIVHVQVGSCGNDIGEKFWDVILKEHKLNKYGIHGTEQYCATKDMDELQYINVFFMEGANRKYIPRAILVDFDPGKLSVMKSKLPQNSLFKPDNIVVGKNGPIYNWANGYYKGKQLALLTLDRVRKEAEACESMQGIQIVHSLSGGTGSGIGSLLAEKMRNEYPGRILKSYAVMPLSKPYNHGLVPYNAVLSMHHLINFVDEVVCVDNNSICSAQTLPKHSQSYEVVNRLIASCMSGITASLRFPGQLNTDLHKLKTNLVPFPQLHFLVPAYAPQKNNNYPKLSVRELTQQMFDSNNMFVNCDLRKGKLLAATTIFRGKISPMEVDKEILNIKDRDSPRFVDWTPCNVQTAICHEKMCDIEMCATSLFNTTAIREPLEVLYDQFLSMFSNRSHLRQYTGEGMEEKQFVDAQNKLFCLISKYREHEKPSLRRDM